MTLSKEENRKRQLESARRSLLAMREKLVAGLSRDKIPEALKEGDGKGDEADLASAVQEKDLVSLLGQRGKEKLAAIDAALEKIKSSEYGVCEECGEKIGQGRLKAMPLAKLCVNCQEDFDATMRFARAGQVSPPLELPRGEVAEEEE